MGKNVTEVLIVDLDLLKDDGQFTLHSFRQGGQSKDFSKCPIADGTIRGMGAVAHEMVASTIAKRVRQHLEGVDTDERNSVHVVVLAAGINRTSRPTFDDAFLVECQGRVLQLELGRLELAGKDLDTVARFKGHGYHLAAVPYKTAAEQRANSGPIQNRITYAVHHHDKPKTIDTKLVEKLAAGAGHSRG